MHSRRIAHRAVALSSLLLAAAWGSCRREAPAPVSRPAVSAAAGRTATTPDACKRCDGEWGAHGLSGREGCLCKARDEGKRCRDGSECEGDCLVVEGEREVVEQGPPPRGHFIGRCSRLVGTFGCHARLADGTLARGPQRLDLSPPVVCVD